MSEFLSTLIFGNCRVTNLLTIVTRPQTLEITITNWSFPGEIDHIAIETRVVVVFK